ncbi:MAG: FKBP-type peptidyl-prolyl cis-trans isomerase [Rikenellaceae bacterium]
MAKRPSKEYVATQVKFLEDRASQSDVQTLTRGVLYKAITEGSGEKHPTLQSVVSVHYEGRLTNGRTFDSTHQNSYPETFRLREVIEGWQIALQAMRVGDVWEVYIPSDVGYGDRTIDNIPGGSTLIFEIELLCIN